MTKDPRNSSSPSPFISSSLLETWYILKTHFDLVNALPLVQSFSGSHFTRRTTHGDKMDQSRLDRFYLSGNNFWIRVLHNLQHIKTQTLSDRDPIILTIQLEPNNLVTTLKKSSYFKANPGVLKREGMMVGLHNAWIAHSTRLSDLTRKFTLAWDHLRNKYKTI